MDDQDSDVEIDRKLKKELPGFQFETEARAAQRRQQQAGKSQRKSTSINRRSKSSATLSRDAANSSMTQPESKPVQPVKTEPQQMTLSERLASIGRITSTLNTSQDEPNAESESVHTRK